MKGAGTPIAANIFSLSDSIVHMASNAVARDASYAWMLRLGGEGFMKLGFGQAIILSLLTAELPEQAFSGL